MGLFRLLQALIGMISRSVCGAVMVSVLASNNLSPGAVALGYGRGGRETIVRES